MKIQDVHRMHNNPIKKENLISLMNVEDKTRKIYNIPDNKDIKKICEKFKIDTNYLFFNTENNISPVCYYKKTVYIAIDIFEEDFIRDFIKDRISFQLEEHENLIKNKEFEKLFSFIDSRILFTAYKTLFNKIPDNKKFNIFINIYTMAEYGFGEFLDLDFIKEVLKHRKNNDFLKELNSNDEYITIYRGEASLSSTVDKAYSWSTDINTALFFATRFTAFEKAKLYKARIKMSNIIYYTNIRNEKEVLVIPSELENIEITEIFTFKEITDDIIIDLYNYYKKDIRAEYFLEPEGIHGVLHTKRVLLLSLLLSKLNNFNIDEESILSNASIYHDIGRVNNKRDSSHGKLSYEKMKNLNLVDKDFKDIEILRYIVTEHSVSDYLAFKNIENYKIENKERALKLLKAFKDADGLDRVRLKDLNVNYLRTKEAMKLIGVAKELLAGIK